MSINPQQLPELPQLPEGSDRYLKEIDSKENLIKDKATGIKATSSWCTQFFWRSVTYENPSDKTIYLNRFSAINYIVRNSKYLEESEKMSNKTLWHKFKNFFGFSSSIVRRINKIVAGIRKEESDKKAKEQPGQQNKENAQEEKQSKEQTPQLQQAPLSVAPSQPPAADHSLISNPALTVDAQQKSNNETENKETQQKLEHLAKQLSQKTESATAAAAAHPTASGPQPMAAPLSSFPQPSQLPQMHVVATSQHTAASLINTAAQSAIAIPQQELSPHNLLDFQAFLVGNGHTSFKPFKFKHGEDYVAWERDGSINVQKHANFYKSSENPDRAKERMRIEIDETGKLRKTFVDSGEGTIKEEHKKILIAAFKKAEIIPEAEQKEKIQKQEEQKKEVAKQVDNKTTAAVSNQKEQEAKITSPKTQKKKEAPLPTSFEDYEFSDIEAYKIVVTNKSKTAEFAASISNEYLETINLEGDLKSYSDDYACWYDTYTKTFYIQKRADRCQFKDTNKIGFKIDEKTRKVIPTKEIGFKNPAVGPAVLKEGLKLALKNSSQYKFGEKPWDPQMAIHVIQRGLQVVPEEHLKEFSKVLNEAVVKLKDPKVNVDFITSDLKKGIGQDAGGLTRTYLSELFQGILQSHTFQFHDIDDLYLPQAAPKANEAIPSLTPEMQEHYQRIGNIMMYCFHSDKEPNIVGDGFSTARVYTTGRHFDDSLFDAALCLTAEEIEKPFAQLSDQTKLKMCQKLLVGKKGCEFEAKIVNNLLNIDKVFKDFTGKELKTIAGEIYAVLENADQPIPQEVIDATMKEETALKYRDLLKAQYSKIMPKYLFEREPSAESVLGKIGVYLSPIHAIAKGMKAICNPGSKDPNNNKIWDAQFKNADGANISSKIQGVIDRQAIVDSFEFEEEENTTPPTEKEREEIFKKVGWLIKWIKNKNTTPGELRKFLIYTTGGASLGKGVKIKVHKNPNKTPFLYAHSCEHTFDVSGVPSQLLGGNDHTEEGFIKCLQNVLVNPSQFSGA